MPTSAKNRLRYIDWNNLHFALEWIYEASPAQRSSVGRHNFAGLSAWLIRRGGLTVSGGGVTVEAGAGDWVFPPFDDDRRDFSADLQILSIRFRASWGGDNELFKEAVPHRCVSRDHPRLERAARQLLKVAGPRLTRFKDGMMRQPVDVARYVKIQRAFLGWTQEYLEVLEGLGVTLHQVRITDDRVRDAKVRLDSVPLNTAVREGELAKAVGISVAQLNRLFVKEVGVTPRVYFNERKFDYARRLLIHSATPIKQIGFELGHADQAGFTNWFRAKATVSPRAFRSGAMAAE